MKAALKTAACALLASVVIPVVHADFAFNHPGLLHSRDDLDRMKRAVATRQEPTFSGYEIFRRHPASQSNYTLRGPMEMVGRNPTVGQSQYDSDANAAYQCAVMWCITGEKTYAEKSKQIINAWSATLKSITGRDAVLMAGLGPFKMVNAAEIIRYTDAAWSQEEIRQTEKHFREVVYPVIKDFAPFANGNWDTAAIKTMLAIGVFCNDRAMYERALRYYVDGTGDGRVTHYVINDAGQCQESGRDMPHTQLGLAHLGDACEIAWHQGLDLYGYANNRLLKGFEYTAKYNLGEEVPFVETMDRTGKYHHLTISTNGRGQLRAVFEQIYNHYANRMGIAAPYTQRAAEKVRPEGPGLPGADHPGFGTLLFTRPPAKRMATKVPPAPPAAIVAIGSPDGNKLAWIASRDAEHYTVKRSTNPTGAQSVIARNVRDTSLTDTDVSSGTIYRYVVSASNASGESAASYETTICAGLPEPWTQRDIGSVKLGGRTSFDGTTFALEAAGKEIGGTNDEFQFASIPLDGDGAIVAKFVPQTSSQFSKLGLMLRESSATDAAHVALLIGPEATRLVEVPGWKARLLVRTRPGSNTTLVGASPNFSEPIMTHGRLTGQLWLKLQRVHTNVSASISSDGADWTQVGTTSVSLHQKLFAGLFAGSGILNTTTRVRFDNVAATGWPESASERNEFKRAPSGNHIQSPDGTVVVRFFLQSDGSPAYAIDYRDRPLVLESRMGFEPAFTNGFALEGITSSEHTGAWTNRFGERRLVPDNYRELNVQLKHKTGRAMQIVFRAYNEGAAFRYTFPTQNAEFSGELTEFRFPNGAFGYEEHGTEGDYRRAAIAEIQPWCERPLTVELPDGRFASLAEAANVNYPRMLLSPLPAVPGALVTALGGMTSNTERFNQRPDPGAKIGVGESTPWRMFVVGERAGDLLERNYLMLNLNPPSALADSSWIKPGKAMRDGTLTMTNSKAIIDFAATAGLQYVHLDSGWYGSEEFETGDATQSRAGRTRFGNPPEPMDIAELVRYGNSKGVGLIVYVDHRQVKKQRDVIFPLYQKWGIKAVKLGFVEVGPQSETAWITETVQKASEHHLMLNIHDGYRATGNNRTWPNLMTVEGIRGNEHMPTAEHNCTLPFTRYVAGIGDYTVCYYSDRIKTTRAHQLAMAVVSFSPLQWVLWYDRPTHYRGEPEIKFFKQVPTVWDETKVIHGEIGKFATIARRGGDDWFVGTINNNEARQLNLPLTFLKSEHKYTAHIYSDDDSVATRTKVGVETRAVSSQTILGLTLKPAGGQAVWIEEVRK